MIWRDFVQNRTAPQSSISNVKVADLLSICSEQHIVIPLLQILSISVTPFLLCCKAHSEENTAQVFYCKSIFLGSGNTKKKPLRFEYQAKRKFMCMGIWKEKGTIYVLMQLKLAGDSCLNAK